MMTRNARSPKRITSQVADLHKALLSITRAADAGYECHLNARGGYLLDTYTAETVPIARNGEPLRNAGMAETRPRMNIARSPRWVLRGRVEPGRPDGAASRSNSAG